MPTSGDQDRTDRAVERWHVRTRDLRLAADLMRRIYAGHTTRASGDADGHLFRYDMTGVARFGCDRLRHRLLVRSDVRPLDRLVVVSVHGGRLTVHADGAVHRVHAGELLLVEPHRPLHVEMDDLDAGIVRLDAAAVRAVAREHPGVDADRLRFRTAGPDGPARARHWAAVTDHVRDNVLAHDEIAAQPLVRADAFRLLATTLLVTFPNTAREALTGPEERSEPASLRRAVAFIDGNARRDITVEDVAGAARLSVRGLQNLFRRHRRESPLEYLRTVRLAGAHRELRAADPAGGDTVAAVAARWGFPHAGRFSVRYRDRYGHSPGRTLRGGDAVTGSGDERGRVPLT